MAKAGLENHSVQGACRDATVQAPGSFTECGVFIQSGTDRVTAAHLLEEAAFCGVPGGRPGRLPAFAWA